MRRVMVNLSDEEGERLVGMAGKEGRSVSGMARVLVVAGLAGMEARKGVSGKLERFRKGVEAGDPVTVGGVPVVEDAHEAGGMSGVAWRCTRHKRVGCDRVGCVQENP